MDFWIISNKTAVLAYVIAITFFLAPSADAWYILVSLFYLILNISIPIFKKTGPKQLLSILSAAFVIGCALLLDPLFVLLLPVNLYEVAWLSGWKKIYTPLLMLATIPFIPTSFLPAYLLAAFLSLLLLANVRIAIEKSAKWEAEAESMREDLQRLNRSLSENKEYMRQSEYTIKLEERNRISQQIHDDIGHAMAGALIQMEASKRLLAIDPDKSSELIGNAISISKEGLERIRFTLKDAKPRSEELGIHRLRLIVDELSAKHSVDATLAHDGDLESITPIHWKIIQENAIESITNSLKYGKASGIHIEIKVLNKFIKSVVSDNGIGADKVVKGLGIVGMEERAATVGGTVIADGTKGFSVTTLLPC
ncbi:sensor histidine kinase [Cohnella lupini]|uniref:histidine kinase n=1 Tax=Cohnella lupini TaxID=1294267 RepID=A0A3D9I1D9_9BACL|nr:histidine kinase [Cohnella lupini]RED54966.1 signal transduction histidine kinase [Cohnella lupini]